MESRGATMQDQTHISMTSFDGQAYDKSRSRRSVDWRDSGIVIDEDLHFNSISAICNNSSARISTQSAACPLEKVAFEQDVDGDTILHLAVVGCTLDKVKDLIKICDLDAINNMMQTPLHVATMANRPEMVQLLLASGAKLNIHDRRGNTPLHLACQKGLIEIAGIILDDILESTTDNGLTLKHYLQQANFEGQTCIHLAASNNRLDILELLVGEYKADPNCQDSRSGETIMHKAVSKLDVKLVEFVVNLKQHCNRADYSNRKPLDTINILYNSKLDQSQADKLASIHKLVTERIRLCKEQNGCCIADEGSLNDCSSSSNSDYSDSDSDVQ